MGLLAPQDIPGILIHPIQKSPGRLPLPDPVATQQPNRGVSPVHIDMEACGRSHFQEGQDIFGQSAFQPMLERRPEIQQLAVVQGVPEFEIFLRVPRLKSTHAELQECGLRQNKKGPRGFAEASLWVGD
jgi:hypothetical protein